MTKSHEPSFYNRSTTRNIHLSSSIYFDSLSTYRAASNGRALGIGQMIPGQDNCYGIEGNPSLHELQQTVARLDSAHFTYLYPNGMAALAAVMDCFLNPGDHAIIPDRVYGPTRRYLDFLSANKGITASYYDESNPNEIHDLVTSATRIIFIESPSSVTFELTDYDTVVAIAKKHNLVTIADNTWASLALSQPLSHGIDICLTSLTKYASGHSDTFLGSISVNEPALCERLSYHHKITGASASPFDATFVHRGIETLEARLAQHQSNALAIQDALKNMGLKLNLAQNDATTFKKYFRGINGLFSVELDRVYCDEELERFVDALELFRIGESWGGTHSLVLFYQASSFESRRTPPQNTVIRINSGLEPLEHQLQDLQRAFTALERQEAKSA